MAGVQEYSVLLALLSASGVLGMTAFGALFRSRYPYLGEFGGEFQQAARTCFHTAIAFAVTLVASLAVLVVAVWVNRRRRRRHLALAPSWPGPSTRFTSTPWPGTGGSDGLGKKLPGR
ncbi:hypothetical protein CDCA_CDCA01G0051 [Cyanidium caldarium]|uniref:Uncharacterized protein n=1 Tax=Cyanidium caldarium TaxID=2771 RepID=A0AAV9IPL3_CYACA|nr:hypothetical protein CDCA_CDCA01G0051 [Cyanidium caldarium]|eukprot:ctg_1620.g301